MTLKKYMNVNYTKKKKEKTVSLKEFSLEIKILWANMDTWKKVS